MASHVEKGTDQLGVRMDTNPPKPSLSAGCIVRPSVQASETPHRYPPLLLGLTPHELQYAVRST